jgi:hypothetical protein
MNEMNSKKERRQAERERENDKDDMATLKSNGEKLSF